MTEHTNNFIRVRDDKRSYSSTCIRCGFKMSMKQWKELCFEDKLPEIKETA